MGRPLPASKSARTRLKLASSQSLVRRALLRHPCRMHVTTTDPRSLVSLSHAPVIASPPNVASPDRGDIQRRIRRPPCRSQVKSRATEPAGRDTTGRETNSLTKLAGHSAILDLTPRIPAKITSPSVASSLLLMPDRLASPVLRTTPTGFPYFLTSVGRNVAIASAWRTPFRGLSHGQGHRSSITSKDQPASVKHCPGSGTRGCGLAGPSWLSDS